MPLGRKPRRAVFLEAQKAHRTRAEYIDRFPWEQLSNETDLAFGAFVEWLDMPTHIGGDGKLARMQTDLAKKIDRLPQQITGWIKAYDWESRTEAYDDYANNPGNLATRVGVKEYTQKVRMLNNVFLDKVIACIEQIKPEDISLDANLRGILKIVKDMADQATELEQPLTDREREGKINVLTTKLLRNIAATTARSAAKALGGDEFGGTGHSDRGGDEDGGETLLLDGPD